MKNHWDPTTKITIFDHYDHSITRDTRIKSDEWIFDSKFDILKFGNTIQGLDAVERITGSDYLNGTTGVIGSYEKPSLFLKQGHWYTAQSSNILSHIDHTSTNTECFFLETLINIKQSHLAKRTMKQLQNAKPDLKNITSQDEPEYHWLRRAGSVGYQIWACGMGRHSELQIGVSQSQKDILQKFKTKTQVDPSSNISKFQTGETMLQAMLEQKNSQALKYVQGFYNLAQDRGFFDFLNRQVFVNPGQVLNIRTIFTKLYYIGV